MKPDASGECRVHHHLPRFDYLDGIFFPSIARRNRIAALRRRTDFRRSLAPGNAILDIADGGETAAETARRFVAMGVVRAILIGAADDDVVGEILASELERLGGVVRFRGGDRSCVRRVVRFDAPIVPAERPGAATESIDRNPRPEPPPIILSPGESPNDRRGDGIIVVDWSSDPALIADPHGLAHMVKTIVHDANGRMVRLLEADFDRPLPDRRDGAPWAARYGIDRHETTQALIAIVEAAFPRMRDTLELCLGFASMSCDPLEEMYAGNGLWDKNADLLRNIS